MLPTAHWTQQGAALSSTGRSIEEHADALEAEADLSAADNMNTNMSEDADSASLEAQANALEREGDRAQAALDATNEQVDPAY